MNEEKSLMKMSKSDFEKEEMVEETLSLFSEFERRRENLIPILQKIQHTLEY